MNKRAVSDKISARKVANMSVGTVQARFQGRSRLPQMEHCQDATKEQEMDNLTTAMLDRMEPAEIADLTPDVLNTLHWLISDELVKARQRENKLNQAFERRYAGQAQEALMRDGRDTGTVHLADGRFDVAVTRPKKVKWDDAKLRAALDQLDPEEARHFAKVTISIDERKFAAATPAVQAVLAQARTVETGKATYALVEKVAA